MNSPNQQKDGRHGVNKTQDLKLLLSSQPKISSEFETVKSFLLARAPATLISSMCHSQRHRLSCLELLNNCVLSSNRSTRTPLFVRSFISVFCPRKNSSASNQPLQHTFQSTTAIMSIRHDEIFLIQATNCEHGVWPISSSRLTLRHDRYLLNAYWYSAPGFLSKGIATHVVFHLQISTTITWR